MTEAKVSYPDNTGEAIGNVGRPVSFYGAEDHACGTAVFVDDMKSTDNELHMVLIQARRPHAKILSIDYSKYAKTATLVRFLFHGHAYCAFQSSTNRRSSRRDRRQ